MIATTKPPTARTAADVMSRDLVLIPEEMSLRGAARMLARSCVTGAPVVDRDGRCVGVLSATDFVRWANSGAIMGRHPVIDVENVCAEWQVVELDSIPTDVVAAYMTADTITAESSTRIPELARMMLDAHIHRVVIVDSEDRPIGVVSTTDLLSVLAGPARD